jgi:hypothetical protein
MTDKHPKVTPVNDEVGSPSAPNPSVNVFTIALINTARNTGFLSHADHGPTHDKLSNHFIIGPSGSIPKRPK